MNFEQYALIFFSVIFVLSVFVIPKGIDIVALQSENPYKEQIGSYAHWIDELLIAFSGLGFIVLLIASISNMQNQKMRNVS